MRLTHTGEDGAVYVYDESIWTGKKELTVDGVPAVKMTKKSFSVRREDREETIEVKGSFLFGITLQFSSGRSAILCKNKWYEWLLIIFPILGLGLGIFCGAIGGGLSGFFGVLGAFLNALVLRSALKLYIKIPVCIVIGVAMIAAWFGLYLLIVGGIAAAFPDLFG